jgi:hypothetical protein
LSPCTEANEQVKIIAPKIKSLPKECLNLGKNNNEVSKFLLQGKEVNIVKRIYTDEECTQLGGIINEKTKTNSNIQEGDQGHA